MSDMVVQECAKQIVKAKPFAKTQLRLAKHSPEIMIGLGLVGVVSSTVLACRATLKAPAVLEASKQKFADIEEARQQGEDGAIEYSKKDRQQDLVTASVQTAVDFTKLYGVPVILMGMSLFAITKGHGITMKRNAAISSAFAALSAGYGEYRDRVREKYGEDAERNLYYNINEETIETTDEKGKIKKVKVASIGGREHSPYARFFDEGSPAWNPSPELNLTFLRCQQSYANEKLRINGHVFLNEVYDAIGLPRSREGAVVGWVLGENSDNFIDFGLYDPNSRERRMFVNGDENVILLDFNVDGIMYDLI